MGNPCHRLRPLPAAPLVVRLRFLIEVPSPLAAAPLAARREIPWPLHRCAFRVLNRGAQADDRPDVRAHASTEKRMPLEKSL
jgi:hypothetical protein